MSQLLPCESPPHLAGEAAILSKLGPRIDSLDLLRGIAILGIFLMNTWTMSMPQEAYTNPTTYSPDWSFRLSSFPNGDLQQALTGINYWTFVIIHELADMRFITMFSIMFGAGIMLQGERAGIRGRNPWAVHYARMSVLLCFGLIHTFFLWYGDILTAYSLCGILLFPIRRFYPSVLTAIGMLMICSVTAIDMCYACHLDVPINIPAHTIVGIELPTDINPLDIFEKLDTQYYRGGNNPEITAYRGTYNPNTDTFTGSYKNEMKHRVNESLRTLLSGFWTWELPRCGGCILLGMALQKRRFFHGEWSRQAYAAIAGIVTPVGWALTALGVLYNDRNGWTDGRDFFALWGIGVEFNYWGSLLCTFGYMCFGVLLAFWAADPLRYIFRTCLIPIRSVGRTALSNYIGQTLIGTTLFYGHGFGLFGYLTRAQLVLVVLPTWFLQLTVSTIWLRYFRQGPLEWLWHSIVYWKWKSPLLPRNHALIPQTAETIAQ